MPGATGLIQFSLENTQDMFGFQADIDLPEGLEFIKTDGKPEIKMSSRADGCESNIVSNLVSARMVRVGVFSANHTPFAGTDGVLFSIGVKASDSFAGGTVSATNVRFVDKEDKDIILPDCSATVNAVIPAASIQLNATTAELKVGGTVSLTATVLPENATDKTVTWTSSNDGVATVDANGNVTAVALGEATITATCGAVSAGCTVTVVPTPVESVTLSNTSLNLTEGETATLTATIAPENATDKSITWTSSDASVATVDANGKVAAVKTGKATITATSSNGKTASCEVTVTTKLILVETLTIDPTEWSGEEGSEFKITATVLPENAVDKTLTWTSSDEAVATVDSEGNVKVLKDGSCIITVATTDGSDLTAECVITSLSGVDTIFGEGALVDVYDMQGVLVKKGSERSELEMLTPGVYVLRNGNATVKAVIR